MFSLTDQIEHIMPSALEGSVVQTVGMTAAVADFPAPVGSLVEIDRSPQGPLPAEVVGFRDSHTLIYPLDEMTGVRRGNRVRLVRTVPWLRAGDALLGRVVDARGEFIDGKPEPGLPDRTFLQRRPPDPVSRPRIDQTLSTGIRSIDGLLTIGRGQRLGIFAGSGVGKSVMLGMMARYTAADVVVLGLIGERGREVNDFIERDLGKQGLARSVVVVATSDQPALLRLRAAWTATSLAEYFRDQGKDVLLLMDSVTRFAQAQREVGLAAGEPPTTRGFPPSVFSLLPRLVERAGRAPQGSITGLYSVLVEGDDPNEPVADTVRGLLDGHVWLSRRLAGRGQYPAVDVLQSLSRLMNDIVPQEQVAAVSVVREMLSALRDNEDMITIGAYRRGSSAMVDLALDMQDAITAYLKQGIDQPSSVEKARQELGQLIAMARTQRANQKPAGTSV